MHPTIRTWFLTCHQRSSHSPLHIRHKFFCSFIKLPFLLVRPKSHQQCRFDIPVISYCLSQLFKSIHRSWCESRTNRRLALIWRWCAASVMRPLSRGRPRDNSAVHGASEDVPGMTYDVPGVSYPIPWTSGDCPQGVRPADGPGTHSLASTGPFSQAAVHRASGLLRFSQSQRGRIMDRKWGCPQYVRNRKLMSRSCPGNATATLLAALTFFVKNKLILL